MNNLLKKLLPGLLPIIVFIIADEFFDVTVSISIAIIIGIVQGVFIYFKEHRIDYFVFLDTGLIVLLGVISIISHDELFFKLKPGIVQSIMCILLIIMTFAPEKFLLGMLGRYGLSDHINQQNIIFFKKRLKGLTLLIIIHTALVFYSAFFMSKEAWAFISGVLLYIIFGFYLLLEFLRGYFYRKKVINEEIVPIVDENGNIKGKANRSDVHNKTFLLHPVIHLHVINNEGKLFLQKRSSKKFIQPGKWDTAVGGHISWGETIENAILREAKEELNFIPNKITFVKHYIWKSEIEQELVYVFICKDNKNIQINPEEVDDGRFWSKNEIEKQLNNKIFTPNFVYEWQFIKPLLNKKSLNI